MLLFLHMRHGAILEANNIRIESDNPKQDFYFVVPAFNHPFLLYKVESDNELPVNVSIHIGVFRHWHNQWLLNNETMNTL